MFAEFLEFLRPQTMLGKFGTNGIPGLREIPFRVGIIGQTSGGTAALGRRGRSQAIDLKLDFA